MKFTVHTPMGSFTSKELTDISKSQIVGIASAFKRGEANNFDMAGEDKHYYFTKQVLENSVFVIED
jgi:hypothetical protein